MTLDIITTRQISRMPRQIQVSFRAEAETLLQLPMTAHGMDLHLHASHDPRLPPPSTR